MAKGYIYDEIIKFVTKHMQEFKHVQCCIWDTYEEKRVCGELLNGVKTKFFLSKRVSLS
jgi:hypothetical protein